MRELHAMHPQILGILLCLHFKASNPQRKRAIGLRNEGALLVAARLVRGADKKHLVAACGAPLGTPGRVIRIVVGFELVLLAEAVSRPKADPRHRRLQSGRRPLDPAQRLQVLLPELLFQGSFTCWLPEFPKINPRRRVNAVDDATKIDHQFQAFQLPADRVLCAVHLRSNHFQCKPLLEHTA